MQHIYHVEKKTFIKRWLYIERPLWKQQHLLKVTKKNKNKKPKIISF